MEHTKVFTEFVLFVSGNIKSEGDEFNTKPNKKRKTWRQEDFAL